MSDWPGVQAVMTGRVAGVAYWSPWLAARLEVLAVSPACMSGWQTGLDGWVSGLADLAPG
jgi:hypothetical protein